MSIKLKLITGFVVVALIAAVIGVIGLININNMAESAEFMYQNQTMPIAQLVKVTEGFQRQRINVRALVDANNMTERQAIEATLAELTKMVQDAIDISVNFSRRTRADSF